MFKHITNIFKDKYFRFQPGEFLPIYTDGKLANRREFHAYRIKWLITNHRIALYQFTHTRG